MTRVSYTTCDQCGIRDDPAAGVFHLMIRDINGAGIGDLCVACARLSMPLADWSPFDRPA